MSERKTYGTDTSADPERTRKMLDKSFRETQEGALAVLAYVRGWRQNNAGKWWKRGVVGLFDSASEAFEAEERQAAK